VFFFIRADDGIRYFHVTGVQTCALPISFLRVGGMRLFATESSEWTDKALPRMTTLSRGLLFVYLVFSVTAVVTYWLSGMSLFDRSEDCRVGDDGGTAGRACLR